MTEWDRNDPASYDAAARGTAELEISGTDIIGPVVRDGLTSTPKTLPPFLFYDAVGSRLFEKITKLPEYYPTRVERSILESRAGEIARMAISHAGRNVSVLELGAGSATKTQVLLRALVAEQGATTFLPADVSGAALDAAESRLSRELPEVKVHPFSRHILKRWQPDANGTTHSSSSSWEARSETTTSTPRSNSLPTSGRPWGQQVPYSSEPMR